MKSKIAEEYNITAGIYDMRYREEQQVKIGFILNRVRIRDGDTIIDAGCGTGLLLEVASGIVNGWLVGLDSSIGMLLQAKRKGVQADLVLGDVERMPFMDSSADVVFSVSVIQLADDPKMAFKELKRILKKDGIMAISYLRKAGISPPKVEGLKLAVHDSETMKDVFMIGYKEL
ncbi:MAG: class I SAM-dependent methyltransferase [Candidatus Methanosuratus sp.]|nr:class I SAM-dependent methyltransferase [Candidatus Methanosuratincola sp.]